MKYKVIGWIWYEDYSVPFYDKTITFAQRNAIIDEIKKNRYLFSGWHHQEYWGNCVPILNDGKKRGFSQRGWGGVMAEAYGEIEDYSYANYTFSESLRHSSLRFPSEEFNPYDFVCEPLENEHFDVGVSEELFNIAKTKNPFYLEDIESLRYIETNDTITLHYNEESLTFLVADIDRNKKEVDFKEHYLINGKYKVILTHKPMGKVFQRKPLLVSIDNVNEIFKECVKQFDIYTLFELFDSFKIVDVTKGSKSKRVISTLKRFVYEYCEYSFDSSIINKILDYLDDFEFSKEIAYKVIDQNSNIFVNFVMKNFNKGINVDEHIPKLLKVFKDKDFYLMDILLHAIELNPNNKSLRKKYYKASSYFNDNGFILYMGINEYKLLRKNHKQLIDLSDFDKLSSYNVLFIAMLMSYQHIEVKDDNIKSKSFLECIDKYKCIQDGVVKYQKYVNSNYDLINRLEELFMCGIKKECMDMSSYLNGEQYAANYVYKLDYLSGFKFSLKEKIKKMFPEIVEYIDKVYSSKGL